MRLIVKNFGAIKDIDIKIKPLTIFIGEQATGKSTIAKLLAIFNEFDFFINQDKFISYLNNFNINFLQEKTFIEFKNNHILIKYKNKKIYTEALNDFSQNILNTILSIDREKLKRNIIEKVLKENIPVISIEKDTEILLQMLKSGLKEKPIEELGFSKQILYYPSERIMISNFADNIFSFIQDNVKIPNCIINFGSLFELARNKIETYQIPFLKKTKIFKENGRSVININDNQTLALSQTSSGMQSVIPLALITEYYSTKEDTFFIIEEPELNLYPSTQKKLSEFLSEKCLKNDNHLIITTHSPYILTAFSNLIEAGNLADFPEATKEKLRKIIPEKYWINFDDVSAYYVANGLAKNILDKEERSIDANAIDDVSEEIDREFNAILDLKYEDE